MTPLEYTLVCPAPASNYKAFQDEMPQASVVRGPASFGFVAGAGHDSLRWASAASALWRGARRGEEVLQSESPGFPEAAALLTGSHGSTG